MTVPDLRPQLLQFLMEALLVTGQIGDIEDCATSMLILLESEYCDSLPGVSSSRPRSTSSP